MSLLVDIEKKLENFTLNVSFNTENGVLALLGASGAGKSMILRCISGIEHPDRGRIVLNGRVLFDSAGHVDLSPQERRTGYLFQNYALFPNMTVLENIECGIRKSRAATRFERRRLALEMADRMRLTDVISRRATELSGGQMQRTALARVLINEPQILMLDEPFSALDEHLRFALENELAKDIRNFDGPVVLVSHSRDEVFRFADYVAVVSGGGIETCGPMKNVFDNPVTVSAARLTGVKNIAPAVYDAGGFVRVAGWGVTVPCSDEKSPFDKDALKAAGIRMNDIRLKHRNNEPGKSYTFVIDRITENLSSYTLELHNACAAEYQPLFWQVPRDVWETERECAEGEGMIIELFIPDAAVKLLRN